MGGQKKFYNRWTTITEKSKLLAECKLVTSVFGRINLAIKSVSDTAFISNKSQAIMEQAIKLRMDRCMAKAPGLGRPKLA